ncbi:type II secretion system minor pseudopilin GspJ [Pseudomonas juntendi]|uniref:Type II secretion system protein J n=1 Tax=Pseudomonas putida TaxID=303 RepID=A0A1X1A701_PSEPU|nr:type II secretion system minor pseudopilin GspJ [Pseudomonas putida]MEB3902070.1 type II secretion system minor pseudopilin GspJ [Pseudomonas putida]ORL67723.1 type II secretion system protein GspJ [Pseudomonas putida]
MGRSDRGRKRRQRGFTLIELLLAIALFALLAVGTARLLDVLVRADGKRQEQAEDLRALGRAMSLIQRDALHGYLPASLKQRGFGVMLEQQRMAWWIAGVQDSQPLPRSELRLVNYWLKDGVLWRQRHTLEHGQSAPQRLLDGVVELRWRLYVPDVGWQAHWPIVQRRPAPPQALEIILSTKRFQQIRRVFPLAGASQ